MRKFSPRSACALPLGALALVVMMSFPLASARAEEPAKQPSKSTASGGKGGPADTSQAAVEAEVRHRMHEMAEQLKLTPDQKEKLKPIMQDQATQMRAIRAKYVSMPRTPENREAMMKELKALQEANDPRLASVLSADQMAQLKKMREENRAQMRQRMKTSSASASSEKH